MYYTKKMNAEKVKHLMNDFGKAGKPFLFALDYELNAGIFIENPLAQSKVLFKTPLGSNKTDEKSPLTEKSLEKFPISFEEYRLRFEKVMKSLKGGDTYLVNLTVKTPIITQISLFDIFQHSNSPFGLYIPDQFVCFSPERFVQISDGIISTYPMKGTISADIPDAEKLILENKKETAEHATIVDLLRNDISMFADEVKVNRYRYIEKIESINGSIHQVSSEILGKLPIGYQSKLGNIIFGLLPAGSVSGAPKESTLKIINNSEPQKRGFYTGVFGYFDGENLDSGVLIRFIEKRKDGLFFHSGGGITALSNAEDEYNEVLKKIYLPFN